MILKNCPREPGLFRLFPALKGGGTNNREEQPEGCSRFATQNNREQPRTTPLWERSC